MQTLPIIDSPSQTLSATLGGQNCKLTLRTFSTGLYLDLSVSGQAIVSGAVCVDRALLVRAAYTGFVGDLMFLDTQGTDDPSSPGLGTRFVLLYIEPGDIEAAAA